MYPYRLNQKLLGKNNYSDNQFNYDRGTSNHILQSLNANVSNDNKKQDISIIQNYVKNFKPTTFPRNRTYSDTTKNDFKICVVGDRYFKRIRRNDFNKKNCIAVNAPIISLYH